MADFTVQYMPTAASPYETRQWSSGHPHNTKAEAKEEARNYLATYPSRKQCAQIIKTELVDVMFASEAKVGTAGDCLWTGEK